MELQLPYCSNDMFSNLYMSNFKTNEAKPFVYNGAIYLKGLRNNII